MCMRPTLLSVGTWYCHFGVNIPNHHLFSQYPPLLWLPHIQHPMYFLHIPHLFPSSLSNIELITPSICYRVRTSLLPVLLLCTPATFTNHTDSIPDIHHIPSLICSPDRCI